MNDERIKQIFQEALEKEPAARAAYLDRICADDADARARVEQLLRSHDEVGSFLADPEDGGAIDLGEGDVVGRYKLLQRIGEGGFGLVFMAEQTEPVRRKVALKVIKLGMDTRQVIARFEAERQALALMDHPNIAKVFDAGATGSGRPYFVMELVRGVPITEYCDQARLDTAARLELFQLVCGAVQHAHQKGVIHRDLKPSNILVTLHDGRPVPKVIDFGIAKAIDRPLTEKTLFTEFRQMIGTPEYMAPEQAEMSGLDVDTRADIYSLGVLLYELLTGAKPFEIATLLQRGYEEVLRTIREVDPPKPSTRVSSMGDELATVASARHTAPRLLGRLLRGDLDWIVMKALEKDRARRYETASGLALDIGRFLQNDAVLASPPRALYRLRKFARRHRVGVVAGALVVTALGAGLALATAGLLEASGERDRAQSEARRANTASALFEAERDRAQSEAARANSASVELERERDRARMEAKRAKTVSALLESVFQSWSPESVMGANYPARALLDEFDLRYGASISEDPEVEAKLRQVIGSSYRALGVTDRAERHLRAAYELGVELYGENSEFVVDNRHAWALLRHDRGDDRGAEAALRDVLARLDGIGAEAGWRASVHRALADAIRSQARFAEAEAEARRALEIAPPGADRAASQTTLAHVLHARGKTAEAEGLLRDALAFQLERHGENHPATAQALNQYGIVVQSRTRYDEAEKLFRRALASWEHAYGRPDDAILRNLARLLAVRGRLEESERLCTEALAIARERHGPTHRRTAMALVEIGDVHKERKDYAAAKAAYDEALRILRATVGEETLEYDTALRGLAQIHEIQGDYDEAVAGFREVLRLRRRFHGERHGRVAGALHNLATTLELQGEIDQALPYAREAVAMAETLEDEDAASLATKLNLLGILLMRKGRFEESESMFARSLALREEHLGHEHEHVMTSIANLAVLYDLQAHAQLQTEPFRKAKRKYEEAIELGLRLVGEDDLDVALFRCNLAVLELTLGQPEEARAHLEKALAIRRAKLGADHPSTALVLFHRAELRRKTGDVDGAREDYGEVLRIRRARLGEGNPETCRAHAQLGRLELRVGRFDAAREELRRALDGYDAGGHRADAPAVEAGLALGVVLECKGEREEGRALTTRALAEAEDRAAAAAALNAIAWEVLHLGQAAAAEHASRTGGRLAREIHGEEHEAVADHLYTLGTLLHAKAEFDEAESCLRRALAIRRTRFGDRSGYTIAALTELGAVLQSQGRRDEAEACVREAIALEEGLADSAFSEGELLHLRLGALRREAGDAADAEACFRKALERCRRKHGPGSVIETQVLRALAGLYEVTGRTEEAERLLRTALATLIRTYRRDHPTALDVQMELSKLLMQTGRGEQAVPLMEYVAARYAEQHDETAAQVLWARLFLAQAYQAALVPGKAEPLFVRNLEIVRERYGRENQLFVQCAGGLAHLCHNAERWAEAERLRDELLPVMRKVGWPPVDLASELARMVRVLIEQQKFEKAEPFAREVVALRKEHLPKGHWHRANADCLLGHCLAGQKKFEEAEKLLTAGYEAMDAPPEGARVKEQALDAIIAMYEAWGKASKADEWRKRRAAPD